MHFFMLFVLFLGGCVTFTPVEEWHPNWSPEAVEALRHGKLIPGLTVEQVGCILGTWEAFHAHGHVRPSAGEETPDYAIYLFYITDHYGVTGYFDKNRRLQIL